jgi:hypothetical protein
MSEHEIDKLFSNKLTSRSFAYNPKAWEAMEAMLDARKKSYAFYWRSAAVILLLGGLLSIAALNQSVTPTPQEQLMPAPQRDAITYEAEYDQLGSSGFTIGTPDYTLPDEEAAPEENNTLADEAATAEVKEQPEAYAAQKEDAAGEVVEAAPEEVPAAAVAEASVPTSTQEAALTVEPMPQSMPSLGVQLVNKEFAFTTDPISSIPFRRIVRQKPTGRPYVSVAALVSAMDFSATSGAGFSAGVGYKKQLSGKWEVGAELNVVQRSTPNFVFKQDSIFYGFGQERVTHTTEVKSVVHVQLPVYINYTVADKHKFGAGAYAGVLVHADVVTSKEKRNFQELIHKSSEQVQEEKDWVQPFAAGAFVQYSYSLSPDLDLGVRGAGSFTDAGNGDGGKRVLTDARLFLQYGF